MFRKKKVVWLLLLPGLAGLMLFYVVPFFGGIYSSLMDGSFENQFVGLANYERTLQNSMFQLGLKNTWELSLLCAPVIWLLAFLLAAMLKTLKVIPIPSASAVPDAVLCYAADLYADVRLRRRHQPHGDGAGDGARAVAGG